MRYATYFKGEERRLFVGLACMVGRGLALAVLVIALRYIIGDFSHPNGVANGLIEASFALCIACVGSLCSWEARRNITSATKTAVARVRRDLNAKVYRLDADAIERDGRMALHTTIVHDTEMLDRMTNAVLAVMLPTLLSIGVLVGALLWISALFGLGFLTVLFLTWLLIQLTSPIVRKRADAFHRSFATLGKGTLEGIERLELARMSAAEHFELSRRASEIEAVRKTSSAMVSLAAATTELNGLLGNIATLTLLVVGGAANLYGMITVPNLFTAFAILMLLRGHASSIGLYTADIQEGFASMSQIFVLLDLPEQFHYCGRQVISFQGNIEFRNVSFGYDASLLLNRATLDVEAGRCIGVVGPNGAGKTTLVRLMLGLCKPEQGQILADNIEYEHLDIAALRRQIGVVPQFPILFDGTVADNIAYGHPQVMPIDLERAAILAGAHEFISRLPAGYATQIGDTGSLLSGGERQQIAIARALVGTPKLLILDEPLNHLASNALEPILARLRNLSALPSVVLISHNMDAVALADRTYRLQSGTLSPFPQVVHSAPEAGG